MMTKVWLVTGSASGLGREIAEAALASGDRLVATERDPRRLEDLVKTYGDRVRTAAHDVADEDAAYAAVWAVTQFNTPARPRRRAQPMQNAGEKLASRQT
jgi:NAD(P)-dependent dehydrogenase (short-subunit alcohol dehydrogenase family)